MLGTSGVKVLEVPSVTSKSISTIVPTSMVESSSPTHHITTKKLNGKNYLQSMTTSSSFMAQTSTSGHSVADMIDSGERWIVDLGATDHITVMHIFFILIFRIQDRKNCRLQMVNFLWLLTQGLFGLVMIF